MQVNCHPSERFAVTVGHQLSYSQDDIGINGWAVEARVYAEVSCAGMIVST